MAPLPLSGLNHVSRVCLDVPTSARFYSDVLGFTFIKRPSSFDFEGAWLFGFGIGIHLIKGEPLARSATINPRAEHLSFQAPSLAVVEERLHALGVKYVQAIVEEDGIRVSQLFFHDPDNNMIEVCNCDLLPVVPLADIGAAFCTSCHTHDLVSHHHHQHHHDLVGHHDHISRSAMSTSSSDSAASTACDDLAMMSFTYDSSQNAQEDRSSSGSDGDGSSHGGVMAQAAMAAGMMASAQAGVAAAMAASAGGVVGDDVWSSMKRSRGPSSGGSMSRSKSMVNFRVVTPGPRVSIA